MDRFFVTGATDASVKPTHFYCRICRKDVSVLKHGVREILRHFRSTKHFLRDESLCLETPSLRVLDYEGNPKGKEQVERQRERILRTPQVVRD